VASSVTWDTLRQLAGFRATKGCAISLYLDLDPSASPTAGDAATRVNSLVDQGAKSNGANRGEQTHEQRVSLREDFDRIRHFFTEEFDRDGAHGFALFCAGLDNVWQTLPLSEPVPDQIKVGRDLYLAPLVPLVGRGEGAVVAVVSREEGRLYRLQAGRLAEIADLFEEQPGRHDQGGWSQARLQRSVDEDALDHFREVADVLAHTIQPGSGTLLLVSCVEKQRPIFEELLAPHAREALLGWTTVEAHAGEEAAPARPPAAPPPPRGRAAPPGRCRPRDRAPPNDLASRAAPAPRAVRRRRPDASRRLRSGGGPPMPTQRTSLSPASSTTRSSRRPSRRRTSSSSATRRGSTTSRRSA
jgi:hypothetical protein